MGHTVVRMEFVVPTHGAKSRAMDGAPKITGKSGVSRASRVFAELARKNLLYGGLFT
jgi:hypothetical protein